MNNQQSETLNPEDLGLILSLAQPFYADSKAIEGMTANNPVLNGGWDDGSSKIRRGLEQMQQLVRVPRPNYSPTPPQYIEPHPQYIEPPAIIPTIAPVVQQVVDDQMELNFSKKDQAITNELLEKISKQLTKVIAMLESNTTSDAIKLKVDYPDKRIQTVPK
jgi:hypothetical protein